MIAAMSARSETLPSELDPADVQKVLESQGAILFYTEHKIHQHNPILYLLKIIMLVL